MSTLKEQIAIMQHFENGGEIEYYSPNKEGWMITDDPVWSWNTVEYRVKQQKETITIEKRLVKTDGCCYVAEGDSNYFKQYSKDEIAILLETYEVEL